MNFGGPLNILQVKKHYSATENKTKPTQPPIFSKVLLKLAPFHVIALTLCLQPASPAQLSTQVTAHETFSQISF